jgi:hypothetical protein
VRQVQQAFTPLSQSLPKIKYRNNIRKRDRATSPDCLHKPSTSKKSAANEQATDFLILQLTNSEKQKPQSLKLVRLLSRRLRKNRRRTGPQPLECQFQQLLPRSTVEYDRFETFLIPPTQRFQHNTNSSNAYLRQASRLQP